MEEVSEETRGDGNSEPSKEIEMERVNSWFILKPIKRF